MFTTFRFVSSSKRQPALVEGDTRGDGSGDITVASHITAGVGKFANVAHGTSGTVRGRLIVRHPLVTANTRVDISLMDINQNAFRRLSYACFPGRIEISASTTVNVEAEFPTWWIRSFGW